MKHLQDHSHMDQTHKSELQAHYNITQTMTPYVYFRWKPSLYIYHSTLDESAARHTQSCLTFFARETEIHLKIFSTLTHISIYINQQPYITHTYC